MMDVDDFMLAALQRPHINPILYDTYAKLMKLLEKDESLNYMCEKLPAWFTDQLGKQF